MSEKPIINDTVKQLLIKEWGMIFKNLLGITNGKIIIEKDMSVSNPISLNTELLFCHHNKYWKFKAKRKYFSINHLKFFKYFQANDVL